MQVKNTCGPVTEEVVGEVLTETLGSEWRLYERAVYRTRFVCLLWNSLGLEVAFSSHDGFERGGRTGRVYFSTIGSRRTDHTRTLSCMRLCVGTCTLVCMIGVRIGVCT